MVVLSSLQCARLIGVRNLDASFVPGVRKPLFRIYPTLSCLHPQCTTTRPNFRFLISLQHQEKSRIHFPRSHSSTSQRSYFASAQQESTSTGVEASAIPGEEKAGPTESVPGSKQGTGFGLGGSGPKSGGKVRERKRSGIRRPAPEKPVLSSPLTDEQLQIENAATTALLVVFILIICEGLFLAASGFLPEEVDDFAVAYVYPSFSPTVGLFLGGAVLYGLYKYLGGSAPPAK